MYYFCTYFDQHYLDKGLALYHSLTEHCSPFRLWILCLDDVTYRILTEMQLPWVHLILLSDFERDDHPLQNAKQNRSMIEYYFTCTPSLLLYVIDHNPEVDIITYLDADLYFFSSIKPVYQELGNGSVLIIGHRFPPALMDQEIYGIYNVGLVSFRNDDNGLACLHWWRNRCLEWCYCRFENDLWADQKYLDDWPMRFSQVVVLQHKGAGLAPWNLANYRISVSGDTVFIDGQNLIMYHFHGLKMVNQWMYEVNISPYNGKLTKNIKKYIYLPYIQRIHCAKEKLKQYLHSGSTQIQSIQRKQFQNLRDKLRFFRNLIRGDLIIIDDLSEM